MRVLEGWIAFQEGQPEEAARILGEAEEVLADTDDYVTLGNISSAYGRIARRQGNSEHALSKFEKAIDFYNKRDPFNRNLARSFVNIAFVKRLLALQLGNKIDSEAAKLRKRFKKTSKQKDDTRLSPVLLANNAPGFAQKPPNISPKLRKFTRATTIIAATATCTSPSAT